MLVQTQFLPLANLWKYSLLLARPSASYFQVFNVNFQIWMLSVYLNAFWNFKIVIFLLTVPDPFVIRCSTACRWLKILLRLQVNKSYNSGLLAKSPYCMRLTSLWLLEDNFNIFTSWYIIINMYKVKSSLLYLWHVS